ncbi:MAG: alcohol dehydrogenase catalytic domain-containing protein, partial [Frankiaceae bacterium]|nr:alcohol dehydrogenase catalytic domain-containing protein [Frankiaceae bacterium]
MRAVKIVDPHTLALQEVPIPDLGPTDVLVKIAAAGLCHSDLHVLHMPELPIYGRTIGHEGAGYIERLGSAATGFAIGDAVLINVIFFCGQCRSCIEGRANACEVTGSRLRAPTTPGLGPDGAMAEYIALDARYLERLGDLDPAAAAPLADAGTTPM